MPVTLNRERWSGSTVALLDIEGTISSISFVKQVLFLKSRHAAQVCPAECSPSQYPYALKRLTNLARNSWDDAAFQDLIAGAGFPPETRSDADTLLAHVEDLTRRDVKATYLKQLQGQLWKAGYENGDLKTPLFGDVIPTLEQWKHAGKTLAIFSSGSVQAQLQFFSVVEEGPLTRDLRPLFAAHFDPTMVGSKLEHASYEEICRQLKTDAASVSFLTDNVKEAEAAQTAGLYTIVVDRPGNAALSQEDRDRFVVVEKLTDLD